MGRDVRRGARRTGLAVGLRSLLGAAPPSPERIHDLHRDLRQHRLALEARRVGRGGPPPSYPAALRTLERSLGRLRDLTLFRSVLKAATPESPTALERAWRSSLLRRVRTEENTIQRRLERLATRTLGTRRTRALLSPRDRGQGEVAYDREELRRGRRRVGDALARARRRLSPGRAHAFRKELRRVLIVAVGGTAAQRRPPPRLRRLVAELGRLHDLDVALGWVERSPRPGRRRWKERIQRQRDDLARRLRRDLRVPSTRRLIREVAGREAHR